MSTCLQVNCDQCNQVKNFPWSFSNDIIILAKFCKNCSGNFEFIASQQKTENIITDLTFLPYENRTYCDAYYCANNGQFYYYELPIEEVSVPIFLLKSEKHAECFVKFSDVEKFTNYSKKLKE